MAHRSNQAVASQEHPASHPPDEQDPPQARRLLIGWGTALGALGLSTVVLLIALWMLRFPIASFFIGAALAERGVEADFELVNLYLDQAVLTDVRFGSETSPDAAIERVEARWAWAGLAPRLTTIRITSPQLRFQLDPSGRVSAGALDRLRSGAPGRRRPSLPAIELVIEDGTAVLLAPFGEVEAAFQASGTLGQDFSALARIEETSRSGGAYALDGGSAELIAVSRNETIAFRLNADVDGLDWAGAEVRNARLRIMGRAPLDLSRYDVEAAWRVALWRGPRVFAEQLSGAAGFEGLAGATTVEPSTWQGQARLAANVLTLMGNRFESARIGVRGEGGETAGAANWTLSADRFDGLAMISERPSANGEVTFNFRNEQLRGDARLSLANARLNPRAQQRVRAAFPDLPSAPIGPTFAAAERALDAASDRFEVIVPLTLASDGGDLRLQAVAPAEARAATGVVLRLSPLRQDAPALVMQWPGAALHGAVALELSGGGAPHATLLIDTLTWSPGAPFEADGTLALADWRNQGALIAADELDVTLAIAPDGAGRLDLRGPARITGPLGNGEVRDLVPALDIAVLWNPGWRVVSNRGCLPTQIGGIDAAGLSFANGAFALCPLNGALIAADANRNLSGGFIVQRLALNGRMAGPSAQPARLSSDGVVGRFRGRTGDVVLALEADAPRLAIDMAEGRTLAVTLRRMTADAHMSGGSWNVTGAFEHGTLNDPALPGSVSTIAGRWSAAPEDNRPVIRIDAGEALLTANDPASENERTLFNPLRLAAIDAILRDGRIDANGLIVLEEEARQLAAFSAHHEVDEGAGAAQVSAPSIVFGEALQPYHITERARGMIENARGPAAAFADIVWSRDDIDATGRIRLDGVSFATSTMPIIQDVRGEVYFDDLFAITTPPGQSLTVGLVNPGIAVRNGRARFQLLTDQRVSVESAEFDFAGGVLAMAPTTVRLGENETSIVLSLRDVDAASLLANLNIPDLAATGTLEGRFPLRLTNRTAYIDGGELRALPGGGIISYTGDAADNATGPAQIAFQALRSFRYDALRLTLDGDISGDVVSSIEFSGHNSGRAVDLGEIAPVPGLGRVTVRGVPFDFNVRVTAPFRRLAQTAASITDPGIILDRGRAAEDAEAEEPESVDQAPPQPR